MAAVTFALSVLDLAVTDSPLDHGDGAPNDRGGTRLGDVPRSLGLPLGSKTLDVLGSQPEGAVVRRTIGDRPVRRPSAT
jgi:hypothetical protein